MSKRNRSKYGEEIDDLSLQLYFLPDLRPGWCISLTFESFYVHHYCAQSSKVDFHDYAINSGKKEFKEYFSTDFSNIAADAGIFENLNKQCIFKLFGSVQSTLKITF